MLFLTYFLSVTAIFGLLLDDDIYGFCTVEFLTL